MTPTLQLDWFDNAPSTLKVGIRMSVEIHVLAYRLNQNHDLILQRSPLGKDHIARIKGNDHCFSLFSGICHMSGNNLYLLGNHSINRFSAPKTQSQEGSLFPEMAEVTHVLSKDPRKPDAFLLLETEETEESLVNVWISHLVQIKGVISAFEFHPTRAAEEENFILD